MRSPRRRLLAGRTPHTTLSAPKKEESRSAAQRGVSMFFRADELWQMRPLPAANLRRAQTASPRLPGAMAPNASGSGVPGQLIDGCCRDEGRVARDLPRDQQSPPSAERDTGRAVWRPWRRRGEARCSTTASLSAYCLLPMCAVRAAGSPGSTRGSSCRRPYHGRHPVLPGLGGRDDRGLGRDRGARAGEARACGAAGVHGVCAPWLGRRPRPRSAG